MEKKQKDPVVGIICQRSEAIDMTKVYYFRATKNIRAGDTFKFDAAEDVLVREYPVAQP